MNTTTSPRAVGSAARPSTRTATSIRSTRSPFGYTLYVFARSDVNRYLPAPMAGLLGSLRYGGFELMVAAVPFGKDDSGNIALVFGRWTWK